MDEIEKEKRTFLQKICQYPLLLLILITLGVATYLLTVQIRIGVPYWDVFNYLNNALFFAGMEGGGVISYLHPLIPILTSLVFRIGYISINAIFIISAIIFVFGVIGFYLLLKERFTPVQSFAGSLIFISLPVVFPWIASGGIDIPGVAFSIWTIYFMVVGLKRNYKFLYLVLPFFILSFLARYTAGLIILPIILYLLMNQESVKELMKNMKFISVISIEFIALISALGYFFIKLGTVAALYDLIISAMTTSPSAVDDVAYNPNILYYLQNLLNYISIGPFQGSYREILNPSEGSSSILAYVIFSIVIIGISFYVYKSLNHKTKEKYWPNMSPTKISFILVMIIALIISIYYQSFIFSEIILVVILYIFYKLWTINPNKNNSNSCFDLDLLFLYWFSVYLIFHSILPIKVDRYFVTMAPAFAYFIILGLTEFTEKIKEMKYPKQKTYWVYMLIALIFLSSATVTYAGHTPKKAFTVDIGNASNWIMESDPNFKDKIISSDYPNAVSWYMKKNVLGGFSRTFASPEEFAYFLQKNNVDYYIDSINKTHPELKGYSRIKSFGVVAIYKKNNS